MHNRYLLILLFTLAALAGCKKVQPQAPANKVEADSAEINATLINMRLAEQADLTCSLFVKDLGRAYALDEMGYWYSFTRRTDNTPIKKDDHVEIFFRSYLLNGLLIEDTQRTIQVGHRDVVPALDFFLREAHEGDEATMVVPYYLAYGRDGSNVAPAMANCIIYITKITLQK